LRARTVSDNLILTKGTRIAREGLKDILKKNLVAHGGQEKRISWVQWLMPIIPTTQEAEIGGSGPMPAWAKDPT
jgi:hypothetical protein